MADSHAKHHDYHLVDPSPWPFIGSVGALVTALGGVAYMQYLKQEQFNTLNGGEGLKIFGSMEVENPANGKVRQKEYAILNFGESNGFQQITIIHNLDDKYAEQITDRIVGSVELIKTGDNVQ